MTGYDREYAFLRDTARLIESGATLRDLYDAMLTVRGENMRKVDASPKWLRFMATTWHQSPIFVPIRLNEVFGDLRVEHTDDYVLAMIGALGGRHEQEIRAFLLRHDHALREHVFWRIFEVEGGGEISLANIDKYSREEFNWHNTVVLLTDEGTLDRARVLRCCLEALNRDFSAYRAGWFSRVYDALAPTSEEAVVLQDLLLLTLGSPISASVSLATRQLARVHQAGGLDAAAFLDACGPALSGPKQTALTVLRILVALAEGRQVDIGAVADVVALGMGHAHADVQRVAVAALLGFGRVDLVGAQRSTLAPAVAAQLAPVTETPVVVASDVVSRAPGDSAPKPVKLNGWREDEALERFAVLLEDASDAIEFELALAWLAEAADPGALLAPLEKRARKLVEGDNPFPAILLLSARDPDWPYQQPVARWDEALLRTVYRDRIAPEEVPALPSFALRLNEVVAILQGNATRRELLATPTDSHGWIDPSTFRARYAAQVRSLISADADADADAGARRVVSGEGGTPFPGDLTQALLRLAPGEREAVLAKCGLAMPTVTPRIRIEWRSRDSGTMKANGRPMWVFWSPVVHGEKTDRPDIAQPALVPSVPMETFMAPAQSALVVGQLALVHPPSTLSLTAAGVTLMNKALSETAPAGEEAVLRALAWHPGTWTAETVQLVAMGMAAKRAEVRAEAVELFAAAIPSRLDASEAAEGFAACAPACVLARWAASFKDAGTLSGATVIDVLTALLPRLDRSMVGLGALLNVLLDESLRHARSPADTVLYDWLADFRGASATAKTARTLSALADRAAWG